MYKNRFSLTEIIFEVSSEVIAPCRLIHVHRLQAKDNTRICLVNFYHNGYFIGLSTVEPPSWQNQSLVVF